MEQDHKKKDALARKIGLVAKNELCAVAFSIIISFPVIAYVKTIEKSGFSIRFFEYFPELLLIALISTVIVRIANFGIETFSSQSCGYKKIHNIWGVGTITYLLTGLVLMFPFSSPSLTTWEDMKERPKGLRSLLKYLLYALVLIPFALLALFGGDEFFKDVGDAGLLLVLTNLCSSLIPVQPLPGKNIFNYKPMVAIVFVVSAIILVMGYQIKLLLPYSFVLASAIAAFSAIFAWNSLRSERKPETIKK